MWYGWIPVLSKHSPAIIRGHPLTGNSKYLITEDSSGDDSLHVTYVCDDDRHMDMTVKNVEGFFEIDSCKKVDPRRAQVIVMNLYNLLKNSYHVDLTHDSEEGLNIVEADNVDDATVLIADRIVKDCENFPLRAAGIADMKTLRSLYLKSIGSAEYGLSYVERYKQPLGKDLSEYRERLTSVSKFVDAIYATKRDAIQDDLANQSKKTSESTEFLSSVVLAMTIGSMIMSCSAFVFDHQGLGGLLTGFIVSVAAAVPASIILHSYLKRKHRTSADERSCPERSEHF